MKKNYYFYKTFRFIFKPIFKILFRPTIINAEYIPTSCSAIIAGNHKHALDPILVDICTKRVVFTLAKKSLHEGIFGFFFFHFYHLYNCLFLLFSTHFFPYLLSLIFLLY